MYKDFPAIRTRVKNTEAFIQNTESIMGVCRVVISIVTLALGKTSLKICSE